jgi:transposase
MLAKYVRLYLKGQKSDVRDAEAIAEMVEQPTKKFVATKMPQHRDLQGWIEYVNGWSACDCGAEDEWRLDARIEELSNEIQLPARAEPRCERLMRSPTISIFPKGMIHG